VPFRIVGQCLWRGIIKGKEKGKGFKGGGKKKKRKKEKRKEKKGKKENYINLMFYTLYIVRTPVSSANFWPLG
jgi:hypothetical protein